MRRRIGLLVISLSLACGEADPATSMSPTTDGGSVPCGEQCAESCKWDATGLCTSQCIADNCDPS